MNVTFFVVSPHEVRFSRREATLQGAAKETIATRAAEETIAAMLVRVCCLRNSPPCKIHTVYVRRILQGPTSAVMRCR